MNRLPSAWETARLTLRDSTLAEVGELHDMWSSWTDASQWEKTFRPASEEEIAHQVSQSLGLEENRANAFRMQSVRRMGEPGIIGLFALHAGVRRPDEVWLSACLIHPQHRRQGFGTEVMAGLAEQLERLGGYSALWTEVSLSNRPAFEFLTAVGFTTVAEIIRDPIHSGDAIVALILKKWLLSPGGKPPG